MNRLDLIRIDVTVNMLNICRFMRHFKTHFSWLGCQGKYGRSTKEDFVEYDVFYIERDRPWRNEELIALYFFVSGWIENGKVGEAISMLPKPSNIIGRRQEDMLVRHVSF